MANPAKARGTAWETAVVRYLRDHGLPGARRSAQHGAKDVGDIALEPFVLECKDHATLALSEWVRQAKREASNAGADYGVVVAKRRRASVADAYVVMDLETFARLVAAFGAALRDADDAAAWSIRDAFPEPPDDGGRRWVYVDTIEEHILRSLDN